jgi:hypothetical protein
MPYFCGAYGMVRHRIPYFCGACTGAPQNSYFCDEDSVEHHPCATEYIYWCATDEVFPTSDIVTTQDFINFWGKFFVFCFA